MFKQRIVQLLVLLVIPSVSVGVLLTRDSAAIEELQNIESPTEENYTQYSNHDETRRMCLAEFGHHKFCDCLLHEKIINSNFPNYLKIVNHLSNAYDYSGLSKEKRATYERIIEVQDKCTMELRYY